MENRILFKKPNIAELTRKHTVVDMHFHSNYSDGINSIQAIVVRAMKLGIGVAITDHNDIRGAVEIEKYKHVLSIPGIEITSREGSHLLIYFYEINQLKKFYNSYIKPNMGEDLMSATNLHMEQIIGYARKFKCLIFFPHPYSAVYTGICNHHFSKERLEHLLSLVDGVETINSENLHKWNLKSAVLGFNLDKSVVGGSDGHTLYHMGKVVTYAKCRAVRKAFLDSLKAKKACVVGSEIDLLRKMTSNSFKLRSSFKNYPDVFEKNIEYSYKIINSKTKEIGRRIHQKISEGLMKKGFLR